jgi:polyhydroxyalkanoate synthesis regulator phasin
VSDRSGVFDRLRARGEEVFTQVSNELMANPHFVKAMQGALRGKEALDQAASRALKSMNVPTRTEFKRALGRIEALESELAALKSKAARAAKASGPRKAKAVRKPTRSSRKPAPSE